MGVPFYDHVKLYRRRQADLDAAIRRVLESGKLDWGDEVPAFEAEFGAWIGATHIVSVNSGTAALKVALMALDIGPGDEVITVPNTDIASSSAIHHTGARAVWVDVDPVTHTMDIGALRAAIGPRTRAIMPVDLYGHPADLPAVLSIARTRGLAVVEDACLAPGATLDGRKIGSFSTVTCFSFAPTKHLGAFGSAGACATEDAGLAEKMRKLSSYGQARSRHRSLGATGQPLHHETEGLNERLDEIQAAVLRTKLTDLDASIAARRRQAGMYADAFAGLPIDVPQVRAGCGHAFRNYVIQVDDRDAVRARVTAAGVGTALSYAPAMHLQPVYADMGKKRGDYPVTERACDRLLGLPIGPHLDDSQIAEIAGAVRAALR